MGRGVRDQSDKLHWEGCGSDFNTPNMPFVVGRILPYWGYGTQSNIEIVRNAQTTVPGRVGNASWFDTDDLTTGYPGHYGTQGQIDLGIRFANEFIPVFIPDPEPPISPETVLFHDDFESQPAANVSHAAYPDPTVAADPSAPSVGNLGHR